MTWADLLVCGRAEGGECKSDHPVCGSQQTPWGVQAFNALTLPGNEIGVSPVWGFCSFFIPTGLGCGRGRDEGPTDPLPRRDLIEIPKFLPQKKREKRGEGRQGTLICPEALLQKWGASSSLRSLSSPGWGSPRGLLSASGNSPVVPGPWSPRLQRSSCPQWGQSAGSAAPSGQSTRGHRQAPEPGLRLHPEPKAKSWLPECRGTSPVPGSLERRGWPGPRAGPVPAASPGAGLALPAVTRAQPALGGRQGRVAAGADWWPRRGR